MKIKLISAAICITFLLASCASKEEPVVEDMTPVVAVAPIDGYPETEEPEVLEEAECADESSGDDDRETPDDNDFFEETESEDDSAEEADGDFDDEEESDDGSDDEDEEFCDEDDDEDEDDTDFSDDDLELTDQDSEDDGEPEEDLEEAEDSDETEGSEEHEESDEIEEIEEVDEIDEIEEIEEIEDDYLEEYDDTLEDEPELIFLTDDEEEMLPEPDNLLSVSEGELLTISFDTSGWVYLGDLLDDGVIQLEKRQNGLYSTTFTFSSTGTGTSLLEFWVIDPLTDEDVYVRYEVTVTEPVADLPVTVTVPEKTVTAADPIPEFDVPVTEPETEPVAAERDFPPIDTINFSLFSAAELQTFFTDAENIAYYGEEAMLYYEAKVRETHPSSKDIKRSVACYEQLVKKYPTSKWWGEAQERAKYLRKYYYLR